MHANKTLVILYESILFNIFFLFIENAKYSRAGLYIYDCIALRNMFISSQEMSDHFRPATGISFSKALITYFTDVTEIKTSIPRNSYSYYTWASTALFVITQRIEVYPIPPCRRMSMHL